MRMLINNLPISDDVTVSSKKRTFERVIIGQSNLSH